MMIVYVVWHCSQPVWVGDGEARQTKYQQTLKATVVLSVQSVLALNLKSLHVSCAQTDPKIQATQYLFVF